MQIGNIKVAVTESGTRPMVLGKSVDTSVQRPIMAMTGHSGYPKISGRVIRVFEILGFEKYNPKFVKNKQNPTFRVPDISGTRHFEFGFGFTRTTRDATMKAASK